MHVFRLLGPLHVLNARITASRQMTVLSMLLLEANQVVPVGRLVDAVWEDAPPATAKSQIQICISTIRRALNDAGLSDRIATSPAGYQIRVEDGELDLRSFNELLGEGRTAVREHRLEAAASALRRALALYQGEPLTGVDSRVVRAAAARLAERRLAAAEEYLEVELRLGRHRELIDELMALVTEHPLRERLWHQLMTALYRSGRQADALAAYQLARQATVDDLGLEPSESLRSLERAILTGNAEPALVADLELADSEETLVPVPRMTPAAVPDFTGHQELIDELCGFLRRRATPPYSDSVPVVTITGRGGIGKTTLAVHLAHQVAADFPGGQLFVQMGNGLTSGHANGNGDGLAQILDRFLRALGIPGSAVPDGLEARAATFRSRVADARVLIVLDDAVDERHVRALLPGSPTCGVIVTSRKRLAGIPGSRLVEVGVLDQRHAVELLARMVGEARVAAEPAEALQLIQLCGRLPLALRIAAARLIARPHWKVSQLTSRLADESRRLDELAHGGLDVRTSITFSYEALDDGAQRLLRRLGLLDAQDFQGWVTAPLLDADLVTATDTLDTLVDARLVDVVGGFGAATQYRLHDLVRVFARERLGADETAGERFGALTRFLGAWLYLLECGHRTLYGGDYTVIHGAAPRWELPEHLVHELLQDPLMWFENERSAAVAAVGLASRAGIADYCWDLAITMVALFESRRYLDDWRTTHEIALLTAQQAGDSRGEAVMQYSLGALNIVEHRFSEASSRLRVALNMFERNGEAHGRSLALRHLAFLDRVQGDLGSAWHRYEDALSVLRPLGDPVAEAHILTGMASIKLEEGDRDRASDMLEEALQTATSANSGRVHAMVLHRLGELHLEDGELAQAEEELTKALKLVREGRDRAGEAHVLHGLGMLRLRQGLHQHAAATLNHGYAIARRSGDRLATARFCLALARLHRAQRQYPSAMEWASQAITLFDELQASSGRVVAHELLQQIRQEAS